MTKILLVRHGHVEGICPPRFRGRADLDLTERGEREAQRVASKIASGWSPPVIYSSPLKRCLRTSAHIASETSTDVKRLEQINDLDYGDWQNETHDAVRNRHPQLFEQWHRAPARVRFPGGESLQDVAARVADALRNVQEKHADRTVVLVTHDSVSRVAMTLLLGLPLSAYWTFVQQPCCLNEIDVDEQSVRLIRFNDIGHLDEAAA
jgi:probable phosphoglycerate mutase